MERVRILTVVVLAVLLTSTARGADWPQFRCDASRTAAVSEPLPADLDLQWTRPLPPPRPAFPREVRLCYDASYEPVVLGKTMFVPSMVSDTVTALDVETGKERWQFFAGGPVRFAPVAWKDNVYFVSDDGFLYCLDAATGDLRWKVRGLPDDRRDRRMLGNGRLISSWPARGGPVLAEGRIYFAAGLWPADGVFVHAVDAETGQIVWSNTDSNHIPKANMDHGIAQFAGLTPQGYMAMVDGRLVVPCGAQLPAFLDAETGELDTYCMGWGGRIGLPKGSWFVAGAGHLLSHSGDLYDIRQTSQERFRDSRGPVDFKSQLYAGQLLRLRIDPSNQRALGDFRIPVLTPDTLYTDGDGITALDLTSGESQERVKTEEPAYRRNDQYPDHAKMEFPVRWRADSSHQLHIKAGPCLYVGGPGIVQAIRVSDARTEAEIVWQKEIQGTPNRMLAAADRLFVVTREGRIYAFGADAEAEPIMHRPASAATLPEDRWTSTAAEMLKVTNARDGYALVLGIESGRLVEELVRQSELRVIAVDGDAQKVADLRSRLHNAGLYGTRASVHQGDPAAYPFPPYLASLIVSESLHADGTTVDRNTIADVTRMLRPYGGSGCLAITTEQKAELDASLAVLPLDGISVTPSGKWLVFTREGALAESADWSHPLADSGNTGASTDRFVKAPLGLLWFDGALRWHRKPGSAEVRVAGGRIFIKGDRLHAIDVYTGRVQWDVPLPFRHNSGDQIVALEDAVYVTSGKTCFVVDPTTGDVVNQFALPDDAPGPWASVRISGDYLVGQSGTQVICAKRHNGEIHWRHTCSRAKLSIAVGGERVFCSELINQRRGEAESDATMTRSLDLKTGQVAWEIVSGSALRYSELHDLLVTSRGVYRGRDGSLVTETAGFDEMHGNQKCDHLSIVGDQLLWGTVTSYAAYDLLSGTAVEDSMMWVRRGCTDLRASSNLITTRYRGNCAYIDLDSREITPLWNVRPACNNNLFPADGVLNIPCLTGGCECNYTPASQAYVPAYLLDGDFSD